MSENHFKKLAFKNQKGFTLIESIMVIVLLGIVGAVTVPMFSNIRGLSLREIANQIAQDIRLAQDVSYLESRDLRFDADRGSYKIVYDTDRDIIINNPQTNQDLNVTLPEGYQFGVDSLSFVIKENRLFSELPVANQNITIVVAESANNGNRLSVIIDYQTGRIAIQ